MARTDFGPEVRASMQGNANTPVRTPIPRPNPRSPGAQVAGEARDSSGNTGLPPPNRLPGPGRGGMPGMGRGMGPMPRPAPGAIPSGVADIPHVAAAASIAHAILGNRGLR